MGSFQARAVIFDLDGVLVDSEPGYAIALNRVLEREGAEPLTEDESRGLIGTTVEDTWNAIKEMRSLTKPFEYYVGIYSPTLIEIFRAGLELQPGQMQFFFFTLFVILTKNSLFCPFNNKSFPTATSILGFELTIILINESLLFSVSF